MGGSDDGGEYNPQFGENEMRVVIAKSMKLMVISRIQRGNTTGPRFVTGRI
jgi:hypothetical protein